MHADQAGDVQHTKGFAHNHQRDHNHLEGDKDTDDEPVVSKVKELLVLVTTQEIGQDRVEQQRADRSKDRNNRGVLQSRPVAATLQNLRKVT